MKPFLIQQLERYALRLTELDFLLSREDIMGDMSQFLKLSREHAEVSAVASRFARFQQRNARRRWLRPRSSLMPVFKVSTTGWVNAMRCP